MQTSSTKLSLIIPCYNEERTLPSLIERALLLEQHNISLELVVVDDCSSDQSLSMIQQLSKQYPQIKYFQHKINLGKGAALRTGFLHATGDFVGIQDADMEYNPLDYLIMLEPLLSNKADVVYGSRYLRPNSRRVLYFWHTWMNKTLTTLSNMFTNLDITDMETCYKLFRRDLLQKIAPQLKENRFGFEPEITAHIAQAKARIYECAIEYHPRSYEEGKKINWKDGLQALYCILHYSAYTAPVAMQILIYFFIGSISAISNLICFATLHSLSVSFYLSVISAFIFAATINYILCILILFKHNARWNTLGEIFIYLITIFIMGCFDFFTTKTLISSGFSPLWSKFLSALVGFIGNYILRRFIVFPHKTL